MSLLRNKFSGFYDIRNFLMCVISIKRIKNLHNDFSKFNKSKNNSNNNSNNNSESLKKQLKSSTDDKKKNSELNCTQFTEPTDSSTDERND